MKTKSAVFLYLAFMSLIGCSTEHESAQEVAPVAGSNLTVSLAVVYTTLGLASGSIPLEPVGMTASLTCGDSAERHYFSSSGAEGDLWSFNATLADTCSSPVVTSLQFRRLDVLETGFRSVFQGSSNVSDPLGDATYNLEDGTLSFNYVGAKSTALATTSAKHDTRFSSYNFELAPGHSCPKVTLDPLLASVSQDRLTIVLPNEMGNLPDTMTSAGDARFMGPVIGDGSTINYIFSFEDLVPGQGHEYSATVMALWGDAENPSAFCGGTLTFTLDHLNFDTVEAGE